MKRVTLAAVATLAVLGGVFGATAGAGTPDDVAAPAGVSARVFQWRSDQIPHRFQIEVSNGSKQPLTVVEARMVSGRYLGEPTWKQRDDADAAVFAPGQAFDLPAEFTRPSCPAKDPKDPKAVAAPVIRLLVKDADGNTAWNRLTATDDEAMLPRVQQIDCLRVSTLAITGIEVQDPVIGGRGRPGTIAVTLTPTGRPGTVTIESVGTTTLLVPARGASWRVDQEVSAATGPVTLNLRVAPNRCDPHAVAEDKVGTLLPFTVSVDGAEPGILTLPPSDQLRNAVYRFVNTTCGQPGT